MQSQIFARNPGWGSQEFGNIRLKQLRHHAAPRSTTQHHADVLLSLLGATTGRKATSSFAFGSFAFGSFAFGSFAFGSCIHQSLSRDVGSRARAVLLKRPETAGRARPPRVISLSVPGPAPAARARRGGSRGADVEVLRPSDDVAQVLEDRLQIGCTSAATSSLPARPQ